MKDKHDPELLLYIDSEGNRVRLNRQIEDEVAVMCYEFIDANGRVPSKKLIRSWVKRLGAAYRDMIITESKDE